MRLTLTTDDGTLLDLITITGDEFRAEVSRNPNGILSGLHPGENALDDA